MTWVNGAMIGEGEVAGSSAKVRKRGASILDMYLV